MTEALAPYDNGHAGMLETVLVKGDLSQLTPQQRLDYINEMCKVVGINPMSRPFQYIVLNDKLTLYATRDCTDQIRKRDNVSVTIIARECMDDVYVVTARATLPDGRTDESTGAVALAKEDGDWKTAASGKRYFAGNGNWKPLHGEDRANAMMKAETKAKRRVTLSIAGLGMLDETEVEDIPTAHTPTVTVEKPSPIKAALSETKPATAHKAPDPELVKLWNEYLAAYTKARQAGIKDIPTLDTLRNNDSPLSEYRAIILDINSQLDELAAKA